MGRGRAEDRQALLGKLLQKRRKQCERLCQEFLIELEACPLAGPPAAPPGQGMVLSPAPPNFAELQLPPSSPQPGSEQREQDAVVHDLAVPEQPMVPCLSSGAAPSDCVPADADTVDPPHLPGDVPQPPAPRRQPAVPAAARLLLREQRRALRQAARHEARLAAVSARRDAAAARLAELEAGCKAREALLACMQAQMTSLNDEKLALFVQLKQVLHIQGVVGKPLAVRSPSPPLHAHKALQQ
jgi:hypothetical protein